MDDKDALWAKFGLMQEAKAKKTAEDEKAQKEKSAIAAAADRDAATSKGEPSVPRGGRHLRRRATLLINELGELYERG